MLINSIIIPDMAPNEYRSKIIVIFSFLFLLFSRWGVTLGRCCQFPARILPQVGQALDFCIGYREVVVLRAAESTRPVQVGVPISVHVGTARVHLYAVHIIYLFVARFIPFARCTFAFKQLPAPFVEEAMVLKA